MIYDFSLLDNVFQSINEQAVHQLTAAIHTNRRIFVYGAGRSGLMLKAFAMRLTQMGKTVHAVGDCTTPAIEEGDLLVLASASGETHSVLNCARVAKSVGATVFSITASDTASLAASTDSVLLICAPTKNSSNTNTVMGTLFEQAVLLLCDNVIARLSADTSQMRARHANLE